MVTWLKLRDVRGPMNSKRDLLFLNSHWDHVGETARLESARLMRREIARQSEPGRLAIVITGDFNCDEDSKPFSTILGEEKDKPRLVDSYRQVHPQRRADEATFHAFKGTTSGSRIDFILHSDALQTVTADIDRTHDSGRFPSDHFPLTVVLKRQD